MHVAVMFALRCDRVKRELTLNKKLWFYIISGKEDNLLRYTQIFENVFLQMLVPFDFHFGISNIFVQWFGFWTFDNFRIYWNISQEIYLPFVPVSKISNFSFFRWKRCNVDSSTIGHIRYLNILTWLRGFCSLIPKGDLDTKKTLKHICIYHGLRNLLLGVMWHFVTMLH